MSVAADRVETAGRSTAHVIDVSRTWGEPTFMQVVTSWLGASAIALLVPFAILLVGLPLVLAIRVAGIVRWIIAASF